MAEGKGVATQGTAPGSDQFMKTLPLVCCFYGMVVKNGYKAWDPEEQITDPNPERRTIEELEIPHEDQDVEDDEFLLPPEIDE